VCANTERLLDLFEEHHVAATFFILGWVAERHPALVARIAAAGHEVACHSHEHRLVYDLTRSQFRDDVRRAKAAIEGAAGTRVFGYRAPSYSITPRSLWALDVLIEEGFVYDASIFPIRHDRYGIPLSPRHPYQIARRGTRTRLRVRADRSAKRRRAPCASGRSTCPWPAAATSASCRMPGRGGASGA
jgi:polysaccharide deacetylase family protein (PEP-CTERM system associated)